MHTDRAGEVGCGETVSGQIDERDRRHPVDPVADAQLTGPVRKQHQLSQSPRMTIGNLGPVPREMKQREHMLRQFGRRIIIFEMEKGRHAGLMRPADLPPPMPVQQGQEDLLQTA